jgi:hypothetical protein
MKLAIVVFIGDPDGPDHLYDMFPIRMCDCRTPRKTFMGAVWFCAHCKGRFPRTEKE